MLRPELDPGSPAHALADSAGLTPVHAARAYGRTPWPSSNATPSSLRLDEDVLIHDQAGPQPGLQPEEDVNGYRYGSIPLQLQFRQYRRLGRRHALARSGRAHRGLDQEHP